MCFFSENILTDLSDFFWWRVGYRLGRAARFAFDTSECVLAGL